MKKKAQLKKITRAIFSLPAVLLALVLPLAGTAAGAEQAARLPPLDTTAPSTFETASFGLG